MCLITFAWQAHPEYRLILAANRDEFHQRPARELHWWPDRPDILGGRDLQAGGTWLAAGRTGRFATVTNYRESTSRTAHERSRGELVSNFVSAELSPHRYAESIEGERYAGFSLLLADADTLFYASNRDELRGPVEPGVHGLSNASLNTPWPKLVRTRNLLSDMIDAGNISESALFRLLADRETTPAAEIEAGALPFALARALTAPFIVTPDYGTRCTNVLLWSHDGEITLAERRFDADGVKTGESRFRFAATA